MQDWQFVSCISKQASAFQVQVPLTTRYAVLQYHQPI